MTCPCCGASCRYRIDSNRGFGSWECKGCGTVMDDRGMPRQPGFWTSDRRSAWDKIESVLSDVLSS